MIILFKVFLIVFCLSGIFLCHKGIKAIIPEFSFFDILASAFLHPVILGCLIGLIIHVALYFSGLGW